MWVECVSVILKLRRLLIDALMLRFATSAHCEVTQNPRFRCKMTENVRCLNI